MTLSTLTLLTKTRQCNLGKALAVRFELMFQTGKRCTPPVPMVQAAVRTVPIFVDGQFKSSGYIAGHTQLCYS